MFAVPAFSSLSSASLKSSFGNTTGSGSNVPTNDPSDPPKPNHRKRKRSQAAESTAAVDITPENIGELWSRVVEGKKELATQESSSSKTVPTSESDKKKDKSRKKRKQNHDDDDSTVNKKVHQEDSNPEAIPNSEHRFSKQIPSDKHDEYKLAEGRMNTGFKRNDDNKTGRRDEKSKHKKDKNKDKQDEQMNGDVSLVATDQQQAINCIQQKASMLTPLQEKMRQKLSGARFRHLNQLLYTTPSQDSLALFKTQPEMFTDYHAGFRQQVESWPENPVDIYIKRLFARGKLRESGFRSSKHKANFISSANASPLGSKGFQDAMESVPLPRAKDGFTTVIDLGCGEAALAKAITSAKPRPKIKVNSYDLHAPNALITVADIANLPLRDGSVDVAIFCLALMGTNWLNMVEEAVRVVRYGGEVWIAEIKSRFARTKIGQQEEAINKEGKKGRGKKNVAKNPKDDTNPADAFVEEQDGNLDQNRWAAGEQSFIEALARRGLRLKNRNGSNKMFVLLDFEKVGTKGRQGFQIPPKPDIHGRISKKFHSNDEPEADEKSILQPCLYKTR
ncbi:25S rRNA (adenine645-N1)-methyltransferase [Orbilia ellipsospora]|uniref:Ribosomal RNA-processing protein 8 n=1 Tax=Orbilia ellipsospora TaxID=2528407 RepID=A0AAV9WYM8_9PEZI